ncbi:hypothetical protein QF037_010107 [Streptomyces canus]|nr:hypothetical protein [Streptomyces canus]
MEEPPQDTTDAVRDIPYGVLRWLLAEATGERHPTRAYRRLGSSRRGELPWDLRGDLTPAPAPA